MLGQIDSISSRSSVRSYIGAGEYEEERRGIDRP